MSANADGGEVQANEGTPLPKAQPTASTQQPQVNTQQPFVPQTYLMLSLPFVVFVLVLLIRALPWSAKMLARKPLVCDACVSFWCALVVGFGLTWATATHWSWVLLHMLATPGVAILLLAVHQWLSAPRELPIPWPEEPLQWPDEPEPIQDTKRRSHSRRK